LSADPNTPMQFFMPFGVAIHDERHSSRFH